MSRADDLRAERDLWRTRAETALHYQDIYETWSRRWKEAAQTYRRRFRDGAAQRAWAIERASTAEREAADHWDAQLQEIAGGLMTEMVDLRSALAEARAALAEIREIVGGLDGESTLNAVQDMVTEWEHYSREMNRAGYETIPRLTDERDAARAALSVSEAARERLVEAGEKLTAHLDHQDSNCAPMYGCFCGCLEALTAWRVLLPAAQEAEDA